MLKAEQFINLGALSRWTQSWDDQIYMNYFDQQIHDRMKQLKVRSSMEENIVKVKKLCADMGKTTDFQTFMKLMNRIIFNCYFKQSPSALRIANFHEEILVPADQKTRQRMFGFQQGQREIGELQVYFEKQHMGQLGEQSDMFHLIYDASFLTEDELFEEEQLILGDSPIKTGPNMFSLGEDVLLTLKIWEPDALNMSIEHFTNLFLYHCSTQLELNFKRASFDTEPDKHQPPMSEKVHVRAVRTEKMPLLYFNSASHHLPPAIVFMSYYHAIDYFFERAKNLSLRTEMQKMFDSTDLEKNSQLQSMAKAVNTLKEDFAEKEALGLLLKRVIDYDTVIPWLDNQPERKAWFTQVQTKYPKLPILQTTHNEDLCHSLVERIYGIKCSLIETPENPEHFIWQPRLDEYLLQQEIPLIKMLAAQIIESWSLKESP